MECISTQIYEFSRVMNFCESQVPVQSNKTQGVKTFCPFHQIIPSAGQMCSSMPLRLQLVTLPDAWRHYFRSNVSGCNIAPYHVKKSLQTDESQQSSFQLFICTWHTVHSCGLSIILKGMQNGDNEIKAGTLLKAKVKFVQKKWCSHFNRNVWILSHSLCTASYLIEGEYHEGGIVL